MKALFHAASLAAILAASPALANFSISPTGSTTLFAIDASNQGTSLCNAASTECAAHVNINTAGAPIGVSGTPFFVTGSGGTFPATLNTTPSLANGNGVVPTQGGAVLSAANGLFANVLQGNAALSASNPSFTSIVQGGNTAVVKTASTATSSDVALVVAVANTNANGANTPGNSSPIVASTFSHASTTALGTSLVAKASAGNLAAYNCTGVAGAAAGYCVAYNGTAAPSTGALTGSLVLDYCYFDATAKGCSLSHIPNSIAFSSGVVILMTSAASPYTYTTGVLTGAIEADYF